MGHPILSLLDCKAEGDVLGQSSGCPRFRACSWALTRVFFSACNALVSAGLQYLLTGDGFVKDDDAVLVGVDVVAGMAGVAADFNRNVDLTFGALE